MKSINDIFEPNPENYTAVSKMEISPLTKLALEMGPLAVFYVSNFKGKWLINNISIFSYFDKPIFPATALFIVAIITALIVSFYLTRKLPIMPLVSTIFVVVFGSLTLWFKDDTFIKMKPTIVNAIFGTILLGGLYFKKPLLGYIFDASFQLTPIGWYKLTFRWGMFFLFLAILNEIIWRCFSTDFWTNFKVFIVSPITLIFFTMQIPLILRTRINF